MSPKRIFAITINRSPLILQCNAHLYIVCTSETSSDLDIFFKVCLINRSTRNFRHLICFIKCIKYYFLCNNLRKWYSVQFTRGQPSNMYFIWLLHFYLDGIRYIIPKRRTTHSIIITNLIHYSYLNTPIVVVARGLRLCAFCILLSWSVGLLYYTKE